MIQCMLEITPYSKSAPSKNISDVARLTTTIHSAVRYSPHSAREYLVGSTGMAGEYPLPRRTVSW
jgi:hypothetical protein